MSEQYAALAKCAPGHLLVPVFGADKYYVGIDGTIVSIFKKKPRVLKPISLGTYIGVQIVSNSGALEKRYIHRIVLESFDRPANDGEQARHLDGNKDNNRIDNLCWGTVLENAKDREIHGTVLNGERNPMAKLSGDLVMEIRKLKGLLPYSKIAELFGVSTMTVYRAANNQSWRNL